MRNERWIRVVAASIVMLLVVGLGQLVVPNQQVMAGDGICCCGETCFEDPGNPYTCGQGCVWYASYKRPDIPDEGWGFAGEWDTRARREGFAVDTNPQPGAILVIEGGWHGALSAGHVAYVEDVDEEDIYISEMNWDCDGDGTRECYCERSIKRSRISQGGISFIYNPNISPPEIDVVWFDNVWQVLGSNVVFEWEPIATTNVQYLIWINGWRYLGPGGDPPYWAEDYGPLETFVDEWLPEGQINYEKSDLPLGLYMWRVKARWIINGRESESWGSHGGVFVVDAGCVETQAQGGLWTTLDGDYCPDPEPTPPVPGPTLTPTVRPTATAGPPTDTPTPAPDRSQCQDETKTGVYLYKDTNYEGACAFFTENHPNLGNTPVGDNGASSIRINGEYGVKLYKDTNYGGGYEEIGASEPDLGWRSLANQFSSIKLQMTQHCDDESLPGVYLYSGKNYEGNCAYFVASHPNLGETAVGGATTSIRINGEYTAWLYEDPNYGGAYDEIGTSDPDLSGRSLHGQYASIKLRVTQHCEDESLPGIFLYSSVGYGGDCLHIIENTPHLEWPPGSIRIIGPFWTKIYEFDDYEGRHDVFYVSEADINWYSLGRRRRSAEVFVIITPTPLPTNTPTGMSTSTPIPTVTSTATRTSMPTSTATATSMATPTRIPTRTPTSSRTPTATAARTPTPTSTAIVTNTATATATNTSTPAQTPTWTPTSVPRQPWLDLTKTLLEPVSGVATVGEMVRFEITIRNTGGIDITTLPLTDVYSGTCLSYLNANPRPDAVTYSERYDCYMALWYNLGRLDIGQNRQLTMDFRAEVPCPAAVNRVGVARAVDARGNPVPPRLAEASVAILAATATQAPTPTPEPTDTPRPTNTPTPTPTLTRTPTSTATGTPTNTPTPTVFKVFLPWIGRE